MSDDLYDFIIIAGVKTPGVVKLTGHDRKVNWDVKAGAGQSGATTTLKDVPPIEFTAAFYLADLEEFNAWAEVDTLIRSTVSGAKPKALDIYHPDLATNGITSVVLASFGGAIHDGKGGQTVTVKLQEYKPPKPKGGSPVGSKTKGPDPNAAANAELAALTNQYKQTPWGSLF